MLFLFRSVDRTIDRAIYYFRRCYYIIITHLSVSIVRTTLTMLVLDKMILSSGCPRATRASAERECSICRQTRNEEDRIAIDTNRARYRICQFIHPPTTNNRSLRSLARSRHARSTAQLLLGEVARDTSIVTIPIFNSFYYLIALPN